MKQQIIYFLRFLYSFVRKKPNYFYKTKEWGLNKEKREKKLIISLTSFPARIKTVGDTIQSVFNQTTKADLVILWLAVSQFPKKEKSLPKSLLKLKKFGLTIQWCDDLRSYKKLIPSLLQYADDIIVTIDDDVYYPPYWLEKLYQSYLQSPEKIHCHRAHLIRFDKNGYPLPYKEWGEQCIDFSTCGKDILMTGVGGVLYPPHSFANDIYNVELFQKLAPNTDDVWFWTMAVLKGTDIQVVENNITNFDAVFNVKVATLWGDNSEGNNDNVLRNIFKHYQQLHNFYKS